MGIIKKDPYLDNMRVRISQIPPLDLKFNHSVLTEYELLVATIEKLNEIVDLTNLTLQEWTELRNWIENELLNHASETLNTMLQNGQLLIDVDYEAESEKLSFVFKSVSSDHGERIDSLENDVFSLETQVSNLDLLKADKSDTYTKTEVDTELSEKVQNFKIKNEIENGDFSQGNIGFIVSGSGSTISVVDGKLNVLAGGQYRGAQRPTTTILNNKYYLRAKIDGSTNIYFGLRNGTPQKYKKINGVEVVSLVRSATSASNNIEVLDNRVSDHTVYTVDELLMVDLTTTFGVGNEPTEIEMDELMKVIPNGWWDGELSLTQKQYMTWLLNLQRKNTNAIIALGGTIV